MKPTRRVVLPTSRHRAVPVHHLLPAGLGPDTPTRTRCGHRIAEGSTFHDEHPADTRLCRICQTLTEAARRKL